MSVVRTIAVKEFRDGLRNRWVVAITIVFALLAIGIAYFGPAASGTVGFASLATTVVSLASLAVFLIPLIALMLAYDSIVGERELGTLLLVLSYPISRRQLIVGKFFGHGAIMAVSTLVGFGAAGLLIAGLTHQLANAEFWGAFGLFIVSATLLGLVFVGIAYLISVSVSEKSKAAGIALVVWFGFVIVFDLALLGVLVVTRGAVGDVGRVIFPYLLLLNPTDMFRAANLIGFSTVRSYVGLASSVNGGVLSPAVLVIGLLVWIVVPLWLAVRRFRRQEI